MATSEPLLEDRPAEPARLNPLGDSGLLIRFDGDLTEAANRAAVATGEILSDAAMPGVLEVSPSLVSVLVRYDPQVTSFADLCAQIRLLLFTGNRREAHEVRTHQVAVKFGGDAGPDLAFVSEASGLSVPEFIAVHNRNPLRVLATGFAPGFVYCGMHRDLPEIPRRKELHASIGPGSVLFAAGQTAITATTVPTGWHVIGRTSFANFDPERDPPTILRPGDLIRFTDEHTP